MNMNNRCEQITKSFAYSDGEAQRVYKGGIAFLLSLRTRHIPALNSLSMVCQSHNHDLQMQSKTCLQGQDIKYCVKVVQVLHMYLEYLQESATVLLETFCFSCKTQHPSVCDVRTDLISIALCNNVAFFNDTQTFLSVTLNTFCSESLEI